MWQEAGPLYSSQTPNAVSSRHSWGSWRARPCRTPRLGWGRRDQLVSQSMLQLSPSLSPAQGVATGRPTVVRGGVLASGPILQGPLSVFL